MLGVIDFMKKFLSRISLKLSKHKFILRLFHFLLKNHILSLADQ